MWAVRVFPFLRNLGIGTLLMSCAEDLLRQRGFRLVEVGVEKDNPDAHRLYHRLGYTVYRALKEEYGYTTPEGVRRWHVVDQWILRELLGRGAGPELMGAWPKAWPGSSLRCGSSRTAGRSRSTKAGASAAQAFN